MLFRDKPKTPLYLDMLDKSPGHFLDFFHPHTEFVRARAGERQIADAEYYWYLALVINRLGGWSMQNDAKTWSADAMRFFEESAREATQKVTPYIDACAIETALKITKPIDGMGDLEKLTKIVDELA